MSPQIKSLTFDSEKFASSLLGYRSEHNLSRKQLAEELGLTASIIRHYENKRTQPPIDVLMRICEIIGGNVNDYCKK